MIKAFLVDDEEHALNILEIFLERIGEVEVIGRSSNGFDAIHQLQTITPDVLFLDIDMPEMNGLELAEIVRNDNADVQIIFITAYDQYALSAFEQAAIDYILKPLELNRLSKTIARIRREMERYGVPSEEVPSAIAEAEHPKLKIRMFGSFFAGAEGGIAMKWRTSKEKELLAYLAVKGSARVHRDVIIDDLWPDENYHKAKIYLHTCVSLLRKNLKQHGFDGIVKYEDERYFLEMNRVAVDVHLYKQCIEKLKKESPVSPVEFERALTFYQGMLLKDEDYLWAEQEAELLSRSIFQCQLTLVESYMKIQEYEKGVELAEKVIHHSPYDEESYRLLMKGYQGLGKNDQVLMVYRRLIDKLEELQIRPSSLTIKLYEEISS